MLRRPPRSTLFPTRRSSDLAPGMAARGKGSIINVSSMAGQIGLAGGAAYGATKAALASLTRAWAAEFKIGRATRLNSSHTVISYAVFCLKKKKRKTQTRRQR